MDREQFADFLRTRRSAIRPEDLGLPRGPRRRTAGLRREEVAALVGMSVDYYSRLEQRRGPQPSEQMVAAIARGLHLSLDERDHLFRLAGHAVPDRGTPGEHPSPAIMRIVDRLHDTPAMVLTELGETLVQNPMARALLGDLSRWQGLQRATVHRWFTAPESRDIYPVADHPLHARVFVAELRLVAAGGGARAAAIVADLLERSPEFAAIWDEHEVSAKHPRRKRFQHPEVGALELDCQSLVDVEGGHRLLVFTATPGSEDADKLALLGVIGEQRLDHRTTPDAGEVTDGSPFVADGG